MAGYEPIAPNITTQHLVDHTTHELLERTPESGQAVVMGRTSGVAHAGELVADCVVEFLVDAFACPEVVPFAVGLGDEVVEVSEVAGLHEGEFGVGGGGDWTGGWGGGG